MNKDTDKSINVKGDLFGGHLDNDEEKLQRSLTNRHIQLLAIGGAIGTGLFMGTGKTLSLSGTSIVLTYMIIGFFFYFIMRAMGELLLSNSNYKSFADFATAYLGPWAGFFLGWSYWMLWIIVAITDIIVIGGYFQFWFPDISQWIPAFITVVTLTTLNLLTVKLFGETEFWFALIKIVAIIAFLLVGIYLIATGFTSPNGVKASLSHIVEAGSIFPHGFSGFLAGFQIAVFAFVGIELIGTTAAETKDPNKTLPKAINSIPLRILLFYVGALICIISVTSWAKVSPSQSPFVHMFTLIGLPIAATLVNFVVTTSAMSSANSGIFATSRMMYGLAVEKDAPEYFKKLSKGRVPVNSLLFSMGCIVIGTSMLFIIPNVMTAFTIFSSLTTVLILFVYGMMLISYLAYRKKAPELHKSSVYKMPMGVVMSWVCLAFLVFVAVVLSLDHDTRIAIYFSPIWFGGLYIAYRYRAKRNAERSWILQHGKRIERE